MAWTFVQAVGLAQQQTERPAPSFQTSLRGFSRLRTKTRAVGSVLRLLSDLLRQLLDRPHPLQRAVDIRMQPVLLPHGLDLLPAHVDLRKVELPDAEFRAELQVSRPVRVDPMASTPTRSAATKSVDVMVTRDATGVPDDGPLPSIPS